MKRLVFVACVALMSAGFVNRAPQSYRVAFDLTSRDTLDQKAALRWIKETSSTHPDVQAEVVMYAKGIELAIADRSPFANEVNRALTGVRWAFGICVFLALCAALCAWFIRDEDAEATMVARKVAAPIG